MDLLAASGVGRDINRHCYDAAEISTALARPVVQRLRALMRLRNNHAAFAGRFSVEPSESTALHLRWDGAPGVFAALRVDFSSLDHGLTHSDASGQIERLSLV